LPPLPKDSTYQLWLLSSGGAASVGTFIPDANGQYSLSTVTPPKVPQPISGVIVTVERAGGNAAPTGRVVLSRPPPVAPPPATNGTP
jgi:anti-sigma-K factor RskA